MLRFAIVLFFAIGTNGCCLFKSSSHFSLGSTYEDDGRRIIVPVLFHVFGDTCEVASRQRLELALIKLSEDFTQTNPDTSQIITEFKNVVGNPNVTFILWNDSTRGEGGTGIKSYPSNISKRGRALELSPLIMPKQVLNIYLFSQDKDGLVLSNTPWDIKDDAIFLNLDEFLYSHRLLTHEAGHWFGLLHTFPSSRYKVLNVFKGGGCEDFDEIDDTPPQQRQTGFCKESMSDCDCQALARQTSVQCSSQIPNYQNYMDYSDCRLMFTRSQAELIRRNVALYRQGIWENSHLH